MSVSPGVRHHPPISVRTVISHRLVWCQAPAPHLVWCQALAISALPGVTPLSILVWCQTPPSYLRPHRNLTPPPAKQRPSKRRTRRGARSPLPVRCPVGAAAPRGGPGFVRAVGKTALRRGRHQRPFRHPPRRSSALNCFVVRHPKNHRRQGIFGEGQSRGKILIGSNACSRFLISSPLRWNGKVAHVFP